MTVAAKARSGSALSRWRTEWRGVRGARARAATPRYLATALLLVLVALGLRALLWPPPQLAPTPRAPVGADAASEDFALQFARAYLTYDAARPAARTRALAPFVPAALDSGAGFFAASGSQSVGWAEVASDQPALAGGRAITVAAEVSTQPLPVYLAVTVRHRRDSGLALVGYPCFVGAPLVDSQSAPAPRTPVEDRAVVAVIDRVLRNYLARSAPNLKADLTPDAVVTLPTLALRARSVEQIDWIAGPGSGAVLATVEATDPRGATYTLAYELGIAYRERPYVDFVEVIPTAT
jgi:hypothetical protein